MEVAVIGCGYVGLITALGLALKGHKVVAIDIDPSRIEKIKMGIVPFHEPGVAEALKKCLQEGSLRVSTAIENVSDCEVNLICVQTPPKPNGAINLQILEKAARTLATFFAKNPRLRTVMIRSTVIPGTTEKFVTPIFQKVSKKTHLAFNPEFLREGSALMDFLNPDRIVIGTHSSHASKVLRQLYSPFNTPIIVTTPSTAELSKYASNTLLATLVSFSNEIARVCEQTPNTDVEDVLGIVHLDKRFKANGKTPLGILSYLKAGCGFGGSCFPKDLSALIAYAHSKGEDPMLLKAVQAINTGQASRVVDMVLNALGGLDKCKIAVLGVAFKGGTDDLRESPGLRIVDELLKGKANVLIYDPLVDAANLKSYEDKGVRIALTLKAALEGADAWVITSNAPEFDKLEDWKELSKGRIVIVDGRRILKGSVNEDRYYAVGRSMRY